MRFWEEEDCKISAEIAWSVAKSLSQLVHKEKGLKYWVKRALRDKRIPENPDVLSASVKRGLAIKNCATKEFLVIPKM